MKTEDLAYAVPTAKRLVDEYLPPDAPNELRQAMIGLTIGLRVLADRHEVCAACLVFAVADMIDQAIDADKIGHESGDDHVEAAMLHPDHETQQ